MTTGLPRLPGCIDPAVTSKKHTSQLPDHDGDCGRQSHAAVHAAFVTVALFQLVDLPLSPSRRPPDISDWLAAVHAQPSGRLGAALLPGAPGLGLRRLDSPPPSAGPDRAGEEHAAPVIAQYSRARA